ncbi:hypothetical protein H5410_001847 [Solanum commersonii]|uniref:Uncharacterized protein n=1 Tax=Solanum commersonii TaxID=4109 RepID=A0A9J6B0R1_SOLCO|nr:hypothetical protein H5410_001847 [Solanum commersonii]
MYDGIKTRIKMVGGDSKDFLVEIRLQHASILSHFLFALVMDELTRSIQKAVPYVTSHKVDIEVRPVTQFILKI